MKSRARKATSSSCATCWACRPGSEPGYLFEQGSRLAGQSTGYADVFSAAPSPGKTRRRAREPRRRAQAAARLQPGAGEPAAARGNAAMTAEHPHPHPVQRPPQRAARHRPGRSGTAQQARTAQARLDRPRKLPPAPRPTTTSPKKRPKTSPPWPSACQRGNTPDAVAHFLTQCLFCCTRRRGPAARQAVRPPHQQPQPHRRAPGAEPRPPVWP